MHRRIVILAAVASLVAAAPGAAHAKGLTGLTICGPDRCVDRSPQLRADTRLMQTLMSYGATVADPGPAPYLLLKESMGDGGETYGRSTVTYYPTLGIQSSSEASFRLAAPEFRRAIARLAHGVRPFGMPAAAPTPARATVASGGSGGGGISTGAWVFGGAAAVLLALGAFATLRRGGRPATG